MRQVTFAVLVLIVLGTTWTLYLQWDNKRFVESLPKPLSQTNIEESTHMSPQDSRSENENTERPAPAAADLFEEIPPDTAHRLPHDGNSYSHAQGPTLHIEQKLTVLESQKQDKDIEQEGESNSPSSFMDLSVEQQIENTRQFLIHQHGDIPEIDIFLKLNAPFFHALKDGATEVSIEMTPEESLENSRVTAILYPTEANKKQYQDELKKMKELGVIK